MPSAIDILKKTIEEYPRNPTKGSLVRVIKSTGSHPEGGWTVARKSDYTADNTCLCLLGHVGAAGGATLTELSTDSRVGGKTYDALLDENGIEQAIGFLYQAVTGDEPGDLATHQLYYAVYDFNDSTLYSTGFVDGRETYTPESIEQVVDKVREALALAEDAARVAEVKATRQALLDAITALEEAAPEDSNAVKILRRSAVEFPKNPTTGELVDRISYGKPLTFENSCMCLLGNIAYSGGVDLDTLARESYAALRDDNGIDEAIRLLAEVINPQQAASVAKHPSADYDPIVYDFNDRTLVVARTEYGKPIFTPESVFNVVAKIHEAIALGEAEQAAAFEKLQERLQREVHRAAKALAAISEEA